jgi:hypothetical protein
MPEFDHSTQTGWPLLGMHQGVACTSCHIDRVFRNVSKQCSSCHADIHHRQFGGNCQQCHTVKGWRVAVQQTREHANRFPLIGAHAATACESCHKSAAAGVFTGLSTDCAACHVADYNKAANPPHRSARIPLQCDQCHSMDTWQGAKFDHEAITGFGLTGGHARLNCNACHVSGQFAGTATQCVACHSKDFNAAQNPNHVQAGFPRDCSVCHNSAQWKGAVFDHAARTKFPLAGSHTQVQCNACHVAGRFAGTPQACEGCHLDAFTKTTNPSHAASNFPRDCAQCHSSAQWKGAKFDHNLSRFRLTGAHVQTDCASCHVNGRFTGTAHACEGCHIAAFEKATNPNHAVSGFPKDCTVCHTTTQWRGALFDHSIQTKFPLTGTHTNTQCSQCHASGAFQGTPQSCDGCHMDSFTKTTDPNHVTAEFPKDCAQCHTTIQWKGVQFDHSARTKFPLTGGHAPVQCAQCHTNNVFRGTPASCEGCHVADFNKTTNPNHAAAGFSKDCTVCHTTVQWKGAKFDHAKTRFPLTGAHSGTQCTSCHVGGKYTGTPTACEGCHLTDFNKTANPNHVTAGFPKDCVVCHTTTQWKGAKFDHTVSTKFALTGSHTSVQCAQCHTNNLFRGTPATCEGCHVADFNKTTNPSHAAAGFSKDCTVCHTTVQWKGAKFDHAKTRFPLTGAHSGTQCTSCHVGGNYAGTPSACEGCHLTDFNKTANPNHVTAGFPKDCVVCHTTTQWKGAKFDHTASTKFPLTGSHTSVQCAQCHKNNVYKGTPATCDGCHLANYNSTNNPNHVTAGFPKDCVVCHTTTQWKGAKFDHTASTKFPLTGSHTSVQCAQCHKNDVYKGTPATCEGCHLSNYNSSTNPNHVTAGFPKDCAVCHTTTQWKGAKFDHTAATKFPLTGSHTLAQCAQCHKNNVYKGTPATCDGCHLANYNATTNPNHVTAGFPKDCAVCHTTTQWKGAIFDHNKTRFPLTGAHPTVSCASCHVGGRYAGTPTDCYACHRKAFETVTNPNHVTAGFPTTCTTCHTTTQWRGAKVTHKFPIYTGKHAGKWTTCNDCHRTPATYAVFSCIDCHEHNKTSMDKEHKGRQGYLYQSPACYQCHPTGKS